MNFPERFALWFLFLVVALDSCSGSRTRKREAELRLERVEALLEQRECP